MGVTVLLPELCSLFENSLALKECVSCSIVLGSAASLWWHSFMVSKKGQGQALARSITLATLITFLLQELS